MARNKSLGQSLARNKSILSSTSGRVKKHFAEIAAKKSRQRRPGETALREIHFFQRTVGNLIPRRPFQLLVREVVINNHSLDYRFRSEALHALQEATEAYAVGLFEDCNLCALHARRVTIMRKDLLLALRLRGTR